MNFIVCSYGGSGSWMLVRYLSNFGKAYHVHDRYPPKKLTYPDIVTERFSKREIEPDKLQTFKVVFIYKNPINAIFSRFNSRYHLHNIQSKVLDYNIIFNRKEDVFGITEFYNTYMKSANRNYDIYCVKYETFFDTIDIFNSTLGITPTSSKQLPIKKETVRHYNIQQHKILTEIYENLITDMKNKPDICVIKTV